MGSMHATRLGLPFIFLVALLGSNIIAGHTVSSNSLGPGRNLLQVDNVSQSSSHLDDTVRVDPLDDFKKYRGGYDITNKHYWSSTAFTGVCGYAIGVLWLLGGIAYGGGFLLCRKFCCKNRRNGKLKKRTPCHGQRYLWPILLALLFTILAIVASGVVLGGNAKFHSRAKVILDIIIDTADDASQTIYNATGAMKEIRDNLGTTSESISGNLGLSSGSIRQASRFLTSTSERLDAEAADLQREARKNRRLIDKGLKIVHIITTVTISLNLAAVIALSVSGTMRLRRALHLLIALCWFLTALCWLFFGVYFFLDKFAGDTCTAMENFQQNPYNNSLSSILPCQELLSAKTALSDVSAGIYNLVNQVNANLSSLQGASSRISEYICNPFSEPPDYQFQPDNCPASSIQIGNIPLVLEVLTCSNPNGTCNDGQFISVNVSTTLEVYSTSIQNLLNVYPGMESLVECQLVKDAFSEILSKHCKPLKKYVHMEWASMVCLSLIMVFLVSIWAIQASNEQESHSLDSSVKPHLTAADEMESGAAEVGKDSPTA